MNNSKNRRLSQGTWKTPCAFWTKVHGDFPETRKSSSLVYRASTPCLSLWERWPSEARTERGSKGARPSPSPAVTALPKGEPRVCTPPPSNIRKMERICTDTLHSLFYDYPSNRQGRFLRVYLKTVNTPKQRVFSACCAPFSLVIHKVFLRKNGFSRRKIPRCWSYSRFSDRP